MAGLGCQHLFQRFSSEVLWHFVGRQCKEDPHKCFQILLSILREGKLRLGSKAEPFVYHHQDGTYEKLYGYPVNCLADIPLKDLPLHYMRYGEFAIGFHRKSAIRNNFMPVLYVPQKNAVIDHYLSLRAEVEKYVKEISPEMDEKFEQFLLMLGSVAKPCNFAENVEEDAVKDYLHLNNFYYEREWRSLYEWDFTPDDVAMIIVSTPKMAWLLKKELMAERLRANITVPILPFEMIFQI